MKFNASSLLAETPEESRREMETMRSRINKAVVLALSAAAFVLLAGALLTGCQTLKGYSAETTVRTPYGVNISVGYGK